jgi:hypothetical protein
MLQAFVITLREGLEAFLIVAISLAYLRKSARHELIPAVHWGIAASIALSIAAGLLLQRASNQALWEGSWRSSPRSLSPHRPHVAAGRHLRHRGRLKRLEQGGAGRARRVRLHPPDDHARRHGDLTLMNALFPGPPTTSSAALSPARSGGVHCLALTCYGHRVNLARSSR